jgi:putative transposase
MVCNIAARQLANYTRISCAAVPDLGDMWHLGEVPLTLNGARHYLWRAVVQDGNVLAILVRRRRDKTAAKQFFRMLLKGLTMSPG